MARQHPAPDRPDVVPDADRSPSRRWPLAVLGVASIAAGILMQVTRDGPLRIPAAVVGVALVLGGIACIRRLVTGWAVLATIVATVWLLSGVAQLAIAATVGGPAGDRLMALGGVSTLIGAAFAGPARYPRADPVHIGQPSTDTGYSAPGDAGAGGRTDDAAEPPGRRPPTRRPGRKHRERDGCPRPAARTGGRRRVG